MTRRRSVNAKILDSNHFSAPPERRNGSTARHNETLSSNTRFSFATLLTEKTRWRHVYRHFNLVQYQDCGSDRWTVDISPNYILRIKQGFPSFSWSRTLLYHSSLHFTSLHFTFISFLVAGSYACRYNQIKTTPHHPQS